MTTSVLIIDRAQSVLGRRRRDASRSVSYRPFGAIGRLGPRGCSAFTGQWQEPATGCYALGNGHRSYSGELARFLRPDEHSPFGKGGINAYAYCAGEPVNRHDPSGEAFSALIIGGLVSSLASAAMHIGTIGGTSAKTIHPNMRTAALLSIVGVAVSTSSLLVASKAPDNPAATVLPWVGIGLTFAATGLRLSVSGPAMFKAGPRKVAGRLFAGILTPDVRRGPSGMAGRVEARR